MEILGRLLDKNIKIKREFEMEMQMWEPQHIIGFIDIGEMVREHVSSEKGLDGTLGDTFWEEKNP